MRVLVVDDHPGLLAALTNLLEERGHTVVACPDAQTAWVEFEREPFPLVLLDISLPGEDGLTFCQRLRQHEFGASSLISIMTGSVDPSILESVIAAGADDYIPKPFSPHQVHIRLAFAEHRAAIVLESWGEYGQHKDTETRFTAFMDHSPAVAWLKDGQGRFVYVNAAFERTHGLPSVDVTGRRASDLWPDSAATLAANDASVLASGMPLETIEAVTGQDGELHYWLSTKFRIKDAAGNIFVGGMAIDITDRHRAERDLRAERELLQTIMDNLPDFLYVKDRTSHFVRMNKAVARFVGLADPAEGIGKTDQDFFPESLALQYLLDEQSVMASGEPVLNRLEAQNEDQTLWSLTSTVPVFDSEGHVTGMVGISRDVTARKQMEELLQRTEERQRALLATIPDMIFRVNRNGEFLYAKNDQRNSLGRPVQELIGQPLDALLGPLPEAQIREAIERALETNGPQIVEIDTVIMQRRFEARILASGWDEVLIVLRDVTEQRLLEEQLAFQATHDPLTGLPNRALFADRLDQALKQSGRNGHRIALLCIDLDNFKSVNDELGHGAGDQLLAEVGQRLLACVRESDTVARLGGDEFAVLITLVHDSSFPTILAERIAANLLEQIVVDGVELHVRASIGIALSTNGSTSAADLIRQADAAMYAIKRTRTARQSESA